MIVKKSCVRRADGRAGRRSTCTPGRQSGHPLSRKTSTMSQNVTLPAMISPAQSLAVAALVNGSSITQAAEKAGVTRETVSRWVHRNPAFIAELQNARAEI